MKKEKRKEKMNAEEFREESPFGPVKACKTEEARNQALKSLDDLRDILLTQKENEKKEEHQAKEANIPPRYRKYTLESMKDIEDKPDYQKSIEKCRKYLTAFDEMQTNGKGILFMGPSGTLKTTLACMIALELIKKDKIKPYFLSCTDLYDFRVRELKGIDYLILDDLGIEYDSEYSTTQIDQIIADSYNNNRIVMITTNLDAREIQKRYSARSMDRMREMMAFAIQTKGKSLRQQK